eukprot:scaffold44756_cov22-Tisochrysis_lutea.AAC.1
MHMHTGLGICRRSSIWPAALRQQRQRQPQPGHAWLLGLSTGRQPQQCRCGKQCGMLVSVWMHVLMRVLCICCHGEDAVILQAGGEHMVAS